MFNYYKIHLLNPAISSLNIGDEIISDGVKAALSNILRDSFIVETSTHLPNSNYTKRLKFFDYKFICGSNLLRGKMNRFFRQWDITYRDILWLSDLILVGVGWWQYNDNPNIYTKILYNKILSKKVVHSVRDEYTKNMLIKLGFNNVVNTGCPSLWSLTKLHCESIPKEKSKTVVFTLTDYNKDIVNDQSIIDILTMIYEQVYFWPQGMNDASYLSKFERIDGIIMLSPNLSSFDNILSTDIDYVGTRLHAGIRALQKKKRSLIIAIDNRAVEMSRDFNLPILHRNDIRKLDRVLIQSIITEIRLPLEEIRYWCNQFIKEEVSK